MSNQWIQFSPSSSITPSMGIGNLWYNVSGNQGRLRPYVYTGNRWMAVGDPIQRNNAYMYQGHTICTLSGGDIAVSTYHYNNGANATFETRTYGMDGIPTPIHEEINVSCGFSFATNVTGTRVAVRTFGCPNVSDALVVYDTSGWVQIGNHVNTSGQQRVVMNASGNQLAIGTFGQEGVGSAGRYNLVASTWTLSGAVITLNVSEE